MTVDIIIPAYNAHKTINTALASIATQKLDDGDSIKVLIVNDASTEGNYNGYVHFWSAMMDVDVLDLEENGGPGTARQMGMDATDGDYIAFLDADDVLGSPFAIRSLIREMNKGVDVAIGTFIEEDPNGNIITHGENWIWLHGKMFRRRTIERFLLSFNGTRACEDVGFLSVLRNLTDNTVYFPQVTYIWQNRGDSTVRGDRDEYAYGEGWRGFIDNMIWAYEELTKRNINKALIRSQSVMCYVRIFNQLQEALKRKPEQKDENLAKVKEFYDIAVRPFVLDDALPYEMISKEWLEMQKETQLICVPQITLKDYLTFTGYYEDRNKVNEAN